MLAVSRPEGVVDVQVRQVAKRLGEVGVVLLLAGMETKVLQKQHLPVGQVRNPLLHVGPHAVGRKAHVAFEQFPQPHGRRLQAEFRIDLALRPSEMAHQDHAAAVLHGTPDRRQGRPDAPVIRNGRAVVERHVEIDPHEDPLPLHVQVVESFLGHGRPPVALTLIGGEPNARPRVRLSLGLSATLSTSRRSRQVIARRPILAAARWAGLPTALSPWGAMPS